MVFHVEGFRWSGGDGTFSRRDFDAAEVVKHETRHIASAGTVQSKIPLRQTNPWLARLHADCDWRANGR